VRACNSSADTVCGPGGRRRALLDYSPGISSQYSLLNLLFIFFFFNFFFFFLITGSSTRRSLLSTYSASVIPGFTHAAGAVIYLVFTIYLFRCFALSALCLIMSVCVEAGNGVLWDLYDPSHYPVYVKDSLLNTNPSFDWGLFRQLENVSLTF
jgi:hypothetical protein